MSTATIIADETLPLRLKALHLPSFLDHYLELAQRASAEGWSHVRYLTEFVALEAHDRADRRMTRLLRDAKLPREKTLATLDLNRFAAPLRGQIRELLRGEFLAGATNVCLIGRPGTGKSHVMAAWVEHWSNTVIRFSSPRLPRSSSDCSMPSEILGSRVSSNGSTPSSALRSMISVTSNTIARRWKCSLLCSPSAMSARA
jgi:hypothetical protein